MQPAEMLAKWQTHMLVYKQSEGTILLVPLNDAFVRSVWESYTLSSAKLFV